MIEVHSTAALQSAPDTLACNTKNESQAQNACVSCILSKIYY